jgi:hypothetical protein
MERIRAQDRNEEADLATVRLVAVLGDFQRSARGGQRKLGDSTVDESDRGPRAAGVAASGEERG